MLEYRPVQKVLLAISWQYTRRLFKGSACGVMSESGTECVVSSYVSSKRYVAILHLLSYAGMLLWCVWLLQRAILLPAPEPLYIFGSGILALRAVEYFYGLFRRNADIQFSFYGLEYCGAGYLISRFGAPSSLVILLFVVGLCILSAQYFATRSHAAEIPQRKSGP